MTYLKYSPCKHDRDTLITVMDDNSLNLDGEVYEFDHEWSGVAYLSINFANPVTTSSSHVAMLMVSYPGGTVSANIIYFTAVGRWK